MAETPEHDPNTPLSSSVAEEKKSSPAYSPAPAEQNLANGELLVLAPRLLRALLQAKETIRTWHGMPFVRTHSPKEMESAAWDLYYRNAPEMREIRELLSDLEKAGVL